MDRDDAIASFLNRYDDDLLAAVASKLFRPRIGQPADELVERIEATWKNPPVIDRLLKALPDFPQLLMAGLGRSRQPRWSMENLLTLMAAFGADDGPAEIATLFERGLLVAECDGAIASFADWFSSEGGRGIVHLPASVMARAAALPFRLQEPQPVKAKPTMPAADGLDWPLRLAAIRQAVRLMPVKLTQAGTLYKRDHTRFTTESILQSPLESGIVPQDTGLLAFLWSRAVGLLSIGDELKAGTWPDAWSQSPIILVTDLFAALYAVREWDPCEGYTSDAQYATATAGLLLGMLLAEAPNDYQSSTVLAEWLWDKHPHWSGLMSKATVETGGESWVDAYFASTLTPLGITEPALFNDGRAYRLTELGRHLFANGPVPATPPAFPQTLLVQPNGEILVYRQGLTPALIAKLTEFAAWKRIGTACTLELNAESVMRGLEEGIALAMLIQTLDRHGMKPTPVNVMDLLRRWADKRERIIVYPNAMLVEFLHAADLDNAISRGIVSFRLTDRVGLTADGSAPDFQHLRLVGNRDYEAKPSACVVAEDDGVTLRVDAAAADLLLDAEIARFAEPLAGTNGDARRYRMSPETLRAAAEQGQTLSNLDEWFLARSGEGLPAAAKLFLLPPYHASLHASRMLVIEVPTSEIADGLLQWPLTAAFVLKRLGPTAFAVEEHQLAPLQERLGQIGLRIESNGRQHLEHLDRRSTVREDNAEPAVKLGADSDRKQI